MSDTPIISESLLQFVIRYTGTGSRIICNPPPVDTDYDVLIEVSDLDKFTKAALMEQWRTKDAKGQDEYEDAPDFTSFRRGDVNLIVTGSSNFYTAFDAATHVAKRLNLLNKSDRVALFQAVLYANKWEDPT